MKLGLEKSKGAYKSFRMTRTSTMFLGKGKGKTTTLVRLALNDIYANRSLVFLDLKGEATQELLSRIPQNRQHDVLLFQPSQNAFAFNLLADIEDTYRPLMASVILEAISSLWPSDVSTTRINTFIGVGVQTLLSVPDTDFLCLKFLLTDKKYREEILAGIDDKYIKDIWHDFDEMTAREQRDKTESTISRLVSFMREPNVRNCIGQEKNHLSFKNKIVLVSLNESDLGAENARLIGSLILASLYMQGVQKLKTTLYVDEGQHFPFISRFLARCPSIPVFFTVQSLSQLKREKDAVLGTVGQIVAFRTSIADATTVDDVFYLSKDNTATQLPVLEDHHAYATRNLGAVRLYMPEHTYPLTTSSTKILKRSHKYTASPSNLAKRLDRFFHG